MPMPKDNLPESEALVSLKEVCKILGVSRLTAYRLIKSGQLPAIRVGGRWKCFRKEIEEYLRDKKFRYDRTAINPLFFRPEVLDKYRNSPTKYYLHEQANDGWVGSNQDAYDVKVLRSAKRPLPAGYRPFMEVHFRKVRLKDDRPALVLEPEQYQALPAPEYTHWATFMISK